jgi:hypothetical protein
MTDWIAPACHNREHFLCSGCHCACHTDPDFYSLHGKPPWMSHQEWDRWVREFSLDFEPPIQIPVKKVSKRQARELEVMVYGP